MAVRAAFDDAIRKLKRDPSRPVRIQVDSLEIELRIAARPLTRGAGRKPRLSFKEYLISMPDVGGDELFERRRERPRPVKLL